MCENCIFCFIDKSVDYAECNNEIIPENLIEKHFSNGAPDCPYYIQSKTSAEVAAEDLYFERLMSDCV